MKVLQFKAGEEKHLEHEFYYMIDKRLQSILYFIAGYLMVVHGVELVITQLHRTNEEQDDIYRSHSDAEVQAAYRANPWVSVHQVNRGADVRVRWPKKLWSYKYLNREEQDEIAADLDSQLDERFEYDFGRKQTSVRHDVGRGDHIHIQVDSHEVTRMKR